MTVNKNYLTQNINKLLSFDKRIKWLIQSEFLLVSDNSKIQTMRNYVTEDMSVKKHLLSMNQTVDCGAALFFFIFHVFNCLYCLHKRGRTCIVDCSYFTALTCGEYAILIFTRRVLSFTIIWVYIFLFLFLFLMNYMRILNSVLFFNNIWNVTVFSWCR